MKLIKNGLIGVLILVVLFVMFFKTESTETVAVKEYENVETTQNNDVLFKGVKPEANIAALTDMITPFKEEIAQDVKVHIVQQIHCRIC